MAFEVFGQRAAEASLATARQALGEAAAEAAWAAGQRMRPDEVVSSALAAGERVDTGPAAAGHGRRPSERHLSGLTMSELSSGCSPSWSSSRSALRVRHACDTDT